MTPEIIEYLSLICPGAVTVIGIIFSILTAYFELKKIITKFSSDKDKYIEALKASDSQFKGKIDELVQQNKELMEVNKALVDHITKIKGYCDVKNKKV